MKSAEILFEVLNDLKQFQSVMQLAITNDKATVEQLKDVIKMASYQCLQVCNEVEDFLAFNEKR